MEDVARQECKKGTFRREELLRRFTARKLFKQLDKRYDQEYQGRLERNWRGIGDGGKKNNQGEEK